MIGLALGISQIISGPVSGHVINSGGFSANYLLLAGVAAATLIPIFFMRETVQHRSAPVQGVAAPA